MLNAKKLFVVLALVASAHEAHGAARRAPYKNLELDMEGREYEPYFAGRVFVKDADPLDAIMAAGKRNLEWLEFINAARADGQKLELSTPATQRGYPIEAPTISNREIVAGDWATLTATFPQVITHVLLEGGDFVSDLPIGDDEFLTVIRQIDRAYQRASRWLLEEPYLDYYTDAAADDIRGLWNLNKETGLEAELSTGWADVTDAHKAELKSWIIGECRNTEGMGDVCDTKWDAAIAADGAPLKMHQEYAPKSQDHWNGYFAIPASRSDVTWTSADPNVFSIPFRDPGRDDVKAWLQTNIQDEWRWPNPASTWQLTLDFRPDGEDSAMTHVKFVAGATPHVNGIAGNEITMDGNRSIQEYTARWTIRHEYGHVLGFPDCYLEFFDKDLKAMVSYQLDITNLMCSRTGHLKQTHFDELKRVYYKEVAGQ